MFTILPMVGCMFLVGQWIVPWLVFPKKEESK